MTYVCGIDCGTQSTKVIVYDAASKKMLGTTSAPHELIAKDDGTMEQEAEWWIEALKKCFAEIDSDIKAQITAIGVSGQQHGFVPLGRNDEVLYNAKLWCDTSTLAECKQITDAYGGNEKLLAEVGNTIIPAYTLPKVLWLKNHKPDLYQNLTTILLPHDYLNFYLTGNKVMEFGDASGSGILNIRTKTWSSQLLKCVDPDKNLLACLPVLIDAKEPAGTVLKDVADELGLGDNVVVSSGGGDNMMGAIGTGTVNKGALTMSLGTSGTLYGSADEPVIDSKGFASAFCSSTNGYLPLVCTQNCTVSTELTRGIFDLGITELESSVSKSPIGSEGVITLPFYTGERTPALPKGKGSVMGLTAQNMKKENILRSSMESAVLSLKIGLSAFTEAGFKPSFVNLIGGGAKSATWRQIVADVLDLPVKVPTQDEAAAFGAALQALWCIDSEEVTMESIIEEHLEYDETKSHKPRPESVQTYKGIYENFNHYIETLTPIYT